MTKKNDRATDWQIPARRYLERLGIAEWRAQGKPIPTRRSPFVRYCPSDYHVRLIDALNQNDEEQFKAIKMLEGYASKVGS